MEGISQESAIQDFEKVDRIDANRFNITKWSRWMDTRGRMLIIAGFYHGQHPDNKHGKYLDRIAVDILNVPEEKVEYMLMADFIQFVRNQKIMPWKDQVLNSQNQTSNENETNTDYRQHWS